MRDRRCGYIGAVSTQPTFLGGQPSGDDGRRVRVAMVGHTMRAGAQPAAGTMLGKSLGSLKAGAGVVDIVLLAR